MLMSVGLPSTAPHVEEQREEHGQFGCRACGSPAITLPDEFHDHAPVHCQGCNRPIATWAVFKRRMTQAILADWKQPGTGRAGLGPDPLDPDLLRVEGAAHITLNQ